MNAPRTKGLEDEISKLLAGMLANIRTELRTEIYDELQRKLRGEVEDEIRSRMKPDHQLPAARGLDCPPIQIRHVLIPVFCLLTGYSEKAVRRKIEIGVWIQGRHYRKAPDGHIVMDLEAYARWVEGKG